MKHLIRVSGKKRRATLLNNAESVRDAAIAKLKDTELLDRLQTVKSSEPSEKSSRICGPSSATTAGSPRDSAYGRRKSVVA